MKRKYNKLIEKLFISCTYRYYKECGFNTDDRAFEIIVEDMVSIIKPNIFNIIEVCVYIVIAKIVYSFDLKVN